MISRGQSLGGLQDDREEKGRSRMNHKDSLTKITIALLAVIVSILLTAIPFAFDLHARVIRIETKMEAMGNMVSNLNRLEQRIVRLEERTRIEGD